MKVGVLFAYMDFERKGRHNRGLLQPQIGPLIASLLPDNVEVKVVNDTWDEPDWSVDYDLLFISSMHSDFDRARQISHYWRRRGAKTVYGGIMASTYPQLCRPYFDAVAIGDPEGNVQQICRDFCNGELKPLYSSGSYDGAEIPIPRYELLADKQVIPLSLEITRGCPFVCDFCALTGFGTRYQYRPVESVVRDIVQGQKILKGLIPRHKERQALFSDNNLGGHPKYMKELCEALAPLNIRWATSMTFNVAADADAVKMLSKAGCRGLFVGLESFNPAALSDMRKFQNKIDKTRTVLDQCRDHGIYVTSGLMLSPLTDDCRYMETIPKRLNECGLHVPGFLSFETPFPGTPFFHRLADRQEGAFLPEALLRDFSGYTMVVKPKREPIDHFIGTYRDVLEQIYSGRSRLSKLADDCKHFFGHGYMIPALADAIHMGQLGHKPHPERTYLANTDTPPPEASSVPFTAEDFDSEEQQRAICEPMRVTDSSGRVLPMWRNSQTLFEHRKRKTT